ncbi:FAD-dependent oxidoreductase [Thermithiobacillus tepidarius DSM 3134]|uniref:FAD-dependent oxidoreductase n=1 Tax=Thermithiobacillus tepidarius TaxID=929 RepID=UPI000416D7DE|nr:FAD-dependent oxidoreductase [Thermithiobacillus tepidarius]
MNDALKLQIEGLRYADLFAREGLLALDARFLERLAAQSPELHATLLRYRAGAFFPPVAESELLIGVARHLDVFLAELFGILPERDALWARQAREDPVFAFKAEFVRAVRKRRGPPPTADFAELGAQLAIPLNDDPDPELAVARLWLAARETGDEAWLARLADWIWLALHTPEGQAATCGWVSLQQPRKLHYQHLVAVQPVDGDPAGRLEGPPAARRQRDGFHLTDRSVRDRRRALDHVHYCVYCHQHDGDFCSKGFPDSSQAGDHGLRVNPLGETLTGCPLGQKISESHVLKREGLTLGALAVIMVDNPLCPATGHRICNDCRKACIYQKQEPVDIPRVETGILTEVLELPWGFELYSLLTRWNPLRVRHPVPAPYNGVKVLVVGTGPAGFNLSQHLLLAGFGVVAIDGLKIEPLPPALTGGAGRPPEAVRDVHALYEDLDSRVMGGFGGVAEYGITVRWDKNFLKLIHITLMRHRHFAVYGGVRFGGTLTIEDAEALGFDHIALAPGAGKPTGIPMPHGLARGIRQANDFLMALQLTGAAKWESLANLQVRLPAVVIGGGLTGIDTATEVQAYYIRQVEKVLARVERVGMPPGLPPLEREILEEFLAHGRLVREERERAAAAGRAPDFVRLIRQWGGVTVTFRRALNESPAYLRSDEEIGKALEEGICYAEALSPVEAELDAHGHVAALRFERQVPVGDGRWVGSGEMLRLPARAVLVAAGATPNTVYEREYPGTFAMHGRYYVPFRVEDEGLVPAPLDSHAKDPRMGFQTSRLGVSVYGDCHPLFHGSVVDAMASGKHGAAEIARIFAERLDHAVDEGEFTAMCRELDRLLRPEVLRVTRLAPNVVELVLRAPQQARKWQPGHFFRLQNFETRASLVEGTRLQLEGLALSGAWADRERGELGLAVLEVGASSRLAARLQPGEPVVLMGPTGTAMPVPSGQTIAVIGSRRALFLLAAVGPVWRAAGNRVYFIGCFRDGAEVFWQERVEAATDFALWAVEEGPLPGPLRTGDLLVRQSAEALARACAAGALPQVGARLREVDVFWALGSAEMMGFTAELLAGPLAPVLKPGAIAYAGVNSPMQCMMKEICAQCVCRHWERDTGQTRRVVFSCFNQNQLLFDVDFGNLAARLAQNSPQERLTDRWLHHLLDQLKG